MVRLAPMTESEVPTYIEPAIEDYAQDKVLADNMRHDRALEMARQDLLRKTFDPQVTSVRLSLPMPMRLAQRQRS